MNSKKGFYSIIQYCADLTRFEAANIGVMLFCPDLNFLDARTSSTNERIRKFFGSEGHNWKQIDSIKLGIEERLRSNHEIRTIAALNEFIDRRANQLRITEPRPIRVHEPSLLLDELFAELVGGTPRHAKKTSIRQKLAEALEQPSLATKLDKSVSITVPVDGRKLDIPYAFQNGRYNLIQPVRFRSENPVQTAYKYAVEGDSIYETRHKQLGEMKLLVVGSFRSKSDENKSVVKKVLEHHNVGLFSMDALGDLVQEILTTGKDKPRGQIKGVRSQ